MSALPVPPRRDRLNWAALTAFGTTLLRAGCVALALQLIGHADASSDSSTNDTVGILAFLVLAVSAGSALLSVVLAAVAITRRHATRGLPLAVTSLLASGGWLLCIAGWVAWLMLRSQGH